MTPSIAPVIEVDIAADANAPGLARRSLEPVFLRTSKAAAQDLELLVSELVTNAVRHADVSRTSTVRLLVLVEAGWIRVEVTDSGVGFEPDLPGWDPSRDHGWGLPMVDAIAPRWGVQRRSGETLVWFEMSA